MKHYYFVKFSVFNNKSHTYQGAFQINFDLESSYNFIFTQILFECTKIYKIGQDKYCDVGDIIIEVLTRIN